MTVKVERMEQEAVGEKRETCRYYELARGGCSVQA